MKNALLYNYNLTIENLQKVKDGTYSFYIDYEKFYFLKISRPQDDIVEILKIVEKYPNTFHRIIMNRFTSPVSKIDDSFYILLKIKGTENTELNLRDILLNQIEYKTSKNILDRSNWSSLWSEKVDYLEYQVSELATNHPIIKKSFSYYVGLAENAITYFNMLKPDDSHLYISHRRISSPSIGLYFYNPLNIVLDFRVRDIASYIKNEYFNRDEESIINEIEFLLEKNVLTSLEYNLLFARLLYPSYYFDELSAILEKGKDEQSILKYIERIPAYEIFLNRIWHMFSKKFSMIKIDWLIKNS